MLRYSYNKISVQQNDVMKCSSSAPVVKSSRVLNAKLLKVVLHHRYFSKNLNTNSKQQY